MVNPPGDLRMYTTEGAGGPVGCGGSVDSKSLVACGVPAPDATKRGGGGG